MVMMHGGKLAARMLKAEGTRYLFSLCGGHTNPLYDGCLDEGIRVIDTRHEQAAAHMAEGWALTTGETGVCCFTAGPGVTNAVTGLVNAAKDQAPVVAIGGSVPVNQFDMHALQELDQLSLMKSFSKWARTVYDTKRIPEYVSMAFRQAWGTPLGPVFLEIPWDIFSIEVEESEVKFPRQYRTHAAPAGAPAQIEAAVALLDKAERPVAIVGSGGFWAKASQALQAFAVRTHIPVFTRYGGRGLIAGDHEHHFHVSILQKALNESDVILVVGTRVDAWLNFGNFASDAKMIWVDTNASEIGHNHSVDVGIVGDARLVLEQLTAAVNAREHRGWLQRLREKEQAVTAALTPFLNSDSQSIHPLRLVKEIQTFLDRDATFVHDDGDVGMLANMVWKAYLPGHFMSTGMPFGALGSGLPFAMAAKLARPNTQVLVLSGDGAFGLSAMEFDTCVRHGINVVAVIANDGCWGMIMRLQEQRHGADRRIGTVLGSRPYHKVVEAIGGHGEFVQRPQDIRPALERAFASGVPACINVVTDRSVGAANVKSLLDAC